MATYRLAGKRYLKKYTASGATPVYAANVDAILCSELMDDVEWEAVSESTAAMTYHTNDLIDQNIGIRNSFDAALFCAEHVSGMHRAYANAACYVFELPEMAEYPDILSLKAHVTSDPYNAVGVRLAVHVADVLDIPQTMAELREGVAHVAGAVPREEREESDKKIYWYPRSGEVAIPVAVRARRYLMLYVGLESYAVARGDWLEGSAYIAPTIEIETSGELSGWSGEGVASAGGEFVVCREDFAPVICEELSIPPQEGATEAPALPPREMVAAHLAGDYFVAGQDDSGLGIKGAPHERLHAAYRAFFEDRMVRASMGEKIMYEDMSRHWWSGDGTFGASFSAGVSWWKDASGVVYATVEGCIWRKKVLVPFIVPAGLSPRTMVLSWTSSDAFAAETGTPILRNVWIARGKRRVQYADADLQGHELYDCCVSKVGDWELVASLRRNVGDTCDGLAVELPFDLAANTAHTLLLTCYIDIGEFKDFSAGVTATDTKGRALGAGAGYSSTGDRHALPGGWMPRIILKG